MLWLTGWGGKRPGAGLAKHGSRDELMLEQAGLLLGFE